MSRGKQRREGDGHNCVCRVANSAERAMGEKQAEIAGLKDTLKSERDKMGAMLASVEHVEQV